MDGLRVTEQPLTLSRQSWFLHRRSLASLPVTGGDPARALEDLGRMTWMALASAVLLFVASLPGGVLVVGVMLIGVACGIVGLAVRRRVVDGPRRALPTIDRARDLRNHGAQLRALRREFGDDTIAPARGRRVELVEARARGVWRVTGDGLVAVLVETDRGVLVLHGPIVAEEFAGAGEPGTGWSVHLASRFRIERLPRTGAVLSATTHGEPRVADRIQEIQASSAVQGRLLALPECSVVPADQLPRELIERMFGTARPYR